jgi:hypothetical protein
MYPRTFWAIILYALVIPIVLIAMMWLNLRLVALNPQDLHFVTYWTGTRAFLFEAKSPYADSVTQQSQEQIYGRLARPNEYAFVATYPLYATFLFAPFALINDYSLARAAWMTLLEFALFATLIFSWRLMRWKPPWWLSFACGFFVLIWVHGLLALLNGDALSLAGIFLVWALLSLQSGRHELAGIALALTTVQALPLLLVVVWILLWSLWKRSWVLPLFFFGTLTLLTVVAMFFSPEWPLAFMRVLVRYPVYPPPNTFGEALAIWWPGIGRQAGWVVTALVGLTLLAEWAMALRRDFRWMLWTACLTLTLAAWVGLPASPMTFTLLLLPLTLVFATWHERTPLFGQTLAIIILLVLAGGLWPILWNGRQEYPWPQIPPGLFLPAPFLVSILLYWVRWWAVRPRRFFEELNARQGL